MKKNLSLDCSHTNRAGFRPSREVGFTLMIIDHFTFLLMTGRTEVQRTGA